MGNLKHGKAFHGMFLRGVSKVETKTPTRKEPSAPFAFASFFDVRRGLSGLQTA